MKLKSKEISNVWTRIFCKERVMCYEILIEIGSGNLLRYFICEDYFHYKERLKELLLTRDSNEMVLVPFKQND